MNEWQPSSWRNYKIKQQAFYKDDVLLHEVEGQLRTYPPLVFAEEAYNLKQRLAAASIGEAFLLQGGDCAESFNCFNANNIMNMFKLIIQMSAILTFAGGVPVIKVGRMAGQFAKPRTSDMEFVNNMYLPVYRGDIINSNEESLIAREADPNRMLQAYSNSAATLNLLRAFSKGGLADLNKVHKWNLDFVKDNAFGEKYEELAHRITETLRFIEACGISTDTTKELREIEFYTSHEALLLNYEEQLCRIDSLSGDYYSCSAHMLWIGDRTRDIDSAHVEFLRGIHNPIGVKIGPSASVDDLLILCDILNPNNDHGRLNFIIRMGADLIENNFPPLLRSVLNENRNVLWSIDPMHGNTIKTNNGYKTRVFDKILDEVKSFFDIHSSENSIVGGIHLEMTGNDVTECIGGSQKIVVDNLKKKYTTQCDPRLNAVQALELAFFLTDMFKQHK